MMKEGRVLSLLSRLLMLCLGSQDEGEDLRGDILNPCDILTEDQTPVK